jgi:serine acetyltransferase
VTDTLQVDRKGPFRGLFSAIRADHNLVVRGDEKYGGKANVRASSLLVDCFRRIGFQMMVAYRVMRFFRAIHLTPLAMLSSRMIRHLYAAEIHWDAELAPGVALVHGVALVLSREARVGSGCILFQSVTLGVSIDPVTREVGGPTLEEDVHVGPGATLLGPITIGRGTKIMANAVVMTSVPAHSVVEVSTPTIRTRARGDSNESVPAMDRTTDQAPA